MQTLDMTFFEEFKRLESVCNDMFSCKSGVTEYINRMEQSAGRGRIVVANWDADYKALKHLRWLRNQIAHDADVAGLCRQEELTQLRRFYKRVLSRQDPLSMLSRAAKSKQPPAKAPRSAAGSEKPRPAAKRENEQEPQEPKRQSRGGAVILLILVILIFLAGLGILYLDISGIVPLSELGDTLRDLPNLIRG